MLKNRYQEILVGLGPVSLIRGIISLKRKKSTLLIDDKRFFVNNLPGLFISELEIFALMRLGKKYDIPELIDIRQFIEPAKIDLVTEEYRLKIGQGPLQNIKEILRKYPELLDESDLDEVYAEQEEEFTTYFLKELERFENQNFEASLRPKGHRFSLQGPRWLKIFFQRFGELLSQEYSVSKSLKFSALLHLLGIMHEEKLRTNLGREEIPFYFFRTLSPIYRLQDFFLSSQLKRRLSILGGDSKESVIQFWQFYENKFENLLLESFEGVISAERVLFFSHLPLEMPFHLKSPHGPYRKTELSTARRNLAPFPPSNMTIMTDTQLLGSEIPYRTISSGNQSIEYHWPYPEMHGSKPEFYEKELRSQFESDSKFLPFLIKGVEVNHCGGVTLDLRQFKSDQKNEAPVLNRLMMEVIHEERPVKGFEYWGPHRYQSYGLLSLFYGIEGI
jgi:hypothetical protein